MFSKFEKELKTHNAPGYHIRQGALNGKIINEWFDKRDWSPPINYLAFMSTIGPGKYYDGDLHIFPLEGNVYSVADFTKEIESGEISTLIAIGYDGTTSGCYCLTAKENDAKVYWFEWAESVIRTVHDDFTKWIEASPKQLFDKRIYAGFKPVKDQDAISRIVEMRRAFSVKLVSFDKSLVRPPGQENDFLPRYNRLAFTVVKTEPADLKSLTVKILRAGSKVGKDNVDYITLDVENLEVNKEYNIEAYSFDAFNLPFENIKSLFEPEINLGSKSRIQYKEIRAFL